MSHSYQDNSEVSAQMLESMKSLEKKENNKSTNNAGMKKVDDKHVLDQALHANRLSQVLPATYIGEITDLNMEGKPMVEYRHKSYLAESLVPIDKSMLGEKCALAFVNGEMSQPLILGLLWSPNATCALVSDHKVEATQSITLACGKSSLTLEADGSVRLKGMTVTTQAYGSNRVKGAAVKIN